MSTLNEAPICASAVARLRSDGWKVACEVEVFDFRDRCDAVALRDDKLMIVEAKVSLNQGLRHQAYRRQLTADLVLAVVGKTPRSQGIEWCKGEGIGLWVVTGQKVNEVVEPRQQNANAHYRKLMIERLANADESVAGGVPHLKGIGVAQDLSTQSRRVPNGASKSNVERGFRARAEPLRDSGEYVLRASL